MIRLFAKGFCPRIDGFYTKSAMALLSSRSASGSLYKLFGVNQDCTHQEIKEAFYRLSKLYHPDVTNDPNARLKFQEIAKAYETLGNPSKRKDYDRGLVQPASNYASVPYEDISEDSIKDLGADSFTSFYVKHYNRALNESWLRQSDPEIIKTAVEFRQDERNFILVFYTVFGFSLLLGYLYAKWIEEPVKVITVSNSSVDS
ncbi:Chaperone protein DnaJ [Paragonimus heterotremus]|uniref:Chaperone protein DnaJ n=1 Tax=Paragonimus heterotremus TaxID=100268 RepID=A0A8J4WCF1_9TREM|nr:Chaperone protein DnaJ [Paragonimus heterotremus]